MSERPLYDPVTGKYYLTEEQLARIRPAPKDTEAHLVVDILIDRGLDLFTDGFHIYGLEDVSDEEARSLAPMAKRLIRVLLARQGGSPRSRKRRVG